ncbi:PREDICTED: putative F-box protein At3g10240 [Camelina sativa]|uniref:F-box protein At3g10240 n=1 Tax=Camelina sativa TaxID=90675 RepID=A0ABM0W2B7_CAMSA|nr:PREDICTED: putative F-box protein At3g10240 [Camelina sativa]
MEQQEEKKRRKVHKRRRRGKQSKSGSSIPLDVTSEILLRLPEKSVVRFRCVSKPWSSITTDPYFISLFKTRSPRLLLCFKANDKLFVSSIPQHHQTFDTWNKSYSSSELIDRYHMELKFPINFDYFRPTESVQGLICFQESATPIVWNPSTRRLLTLPKLNTGWKDITIFLGYDPVEGKHKVMCIPFSKSCDDCRVFTLGSAQKSWRAVKTNYSHRSNYYTSGRCIKGVVYYLAFVYHMDVWVLMSFDVKSEIFDRILLPQSDVHKELIPYEGRLACVDRKPNMKKGFRLWILEDAEKQKWSSKDFLAPRYHFDKSLRCYFLLKGFTSAGEFIYVEQMFHKPSYILFCDPVRNSFRRFELKGITDDQSVLSNVHGYTLHVFPNHIESQISL